MKENLKCEKCECEQFIVCNDKTGYYASDPQPPGLLQPVHMTFQMFFKCKECGMALSVDRIEGEAVITWEIAPKAPGIPVK